MSNKPIDEALYNTLESPQRCPVVTQRRSGTINDYDYTNVTEVIDASYQKLNPASVVTKNTYSSLLSNSSNNKVPQDYLTPVVISESFKEHCHSSKTTSSVMTENKENDNKQQTSTFYLRLLVLLTCVSLLIAITAVILAVIALSTKPASDGPTITSENIRGPNVNISSAELNERLLAFYVNMTTQFTALMDSTNDIVSTVNTLHDELQLIKGVNNIL